MGGVVRDLASRLEIHLNVARETVLSPQNNSY